MFCAKFGDDSWDYRIVYGRPKLDHAQGAHDQIKLTETKSFGSLRTIWMFHPFTS